MFLRHLLFHEGCTSDYSTGRSARPMVVVTGRTSRPVSVRAVTARLRYTRLSHYLCERFPASTLRLCDRRQRQNAVSNKPVHRISSSHTYGFVHLYQRRTARICRWSARWSLSKHCCKGSSSSDSRSCASSNIAPCNFPTRLESITRRTSSAS